LKRYLKEIYDEKKHDGFMFILDDRDEIDISPFTYTTRTKPIETHETIGLKYHVITYKETLDGDIVDLDQFEAIIGDPWHYIGNLIKCGFLGTICKKTRTSKRVVNDIYNDLLQFIEDNVQKEIKPIK